MSHSAKVTRVIDGDTFEATVELGFRVSIHVTVRIFGCDAWETHGCEKNRGIEAKEFVISLIEGKTVELEEHQQDSFGRWLCDVSIKKKDIVKLLAENGYLKT